MPTVDLCVTLWTFLTSSAKLRFIFEMIELNHHIAVIEIREQYPGIIERDMLRELATRRYGGDLANQVYSRGNAVGRNQAKAQVNLCLGEGAFVSPGTFRTNSRATAQPPKMRSPYAALEQISTLRIRYEIR